MKGMSTPVHGKSGRLPGLRAGVVAASAVVVFVLVARHLDTVPLNNEPENLRSTWWHVAVMAVLVVVTLAAAVIALVRGASGGEGRGIGRVAPILLGLFGLVAAAVGAFVILGSLLATRDVST